MNLFTKQEQTYRHWKQTYGYQWGEAQEVGDRSGAWGEHRHISTCETDNQEGCTV